MNVYITLQRVSTGGAGAVDDGAHGREDEALSYAQDAIQHSPERAPPHRDDRCVLSNHLGPNSSAAVRVKLGQRKARKSSGPVTT